MQQYLTNQFAGTGGNIKLTPEDFWVEEIPAYIPSGEGEHLYLWIEKRNCSTLHLVQLLAEQLQLKPADIGFAGLKDKRATTRQWVSVSAPAEISEDRLSALEFDADIKILAVKRHSNKLRLGHLRGNRFKLNIHAVVPDGLKRTQDILHVLEHTGVPNLFGAQRYGVRGNNHSIGEAILRADFDRAAQEIIGTPATISNIHWQKAAQAFADGDIDTAVTVMPRHMRDERRLLQALRGGASSKKAVLSMGKKMLRLYLSAYQSQIFDRQVRMRLDSLDTLWSGDIAC
ncbi:MAG: tRNA pseudouridine(13) synthase TruD, partial [Desulfuromonadaceae bacterium]|nr:tRNA pseudouridine(13) synthase TruD [Desulfuromonadaceae bacterium]